MNVNELNSKVNSVVSSPTKFSKLVRFIAGEQLADCKRLELDALGDVKSLMTGDNETLTEQVILDALVLATAKSGDDIEVSLNNSKILSKTVNCNSCNLVDLEKVRANVYSTLEMKGYIVKSGYSNPEDAFEDPEEGILEDAEASEEYENSPEESDDDAIEDPDDEKVEVTRGNKELEEAISKYYAQYCNGVIQELLKRYTALFSSGYEVNKPAGILTNEGIVKVSGSKRVVVEDTVSTTKIYSLVKSSLEFEEVSTRSILGIANAIYSNYTQGSTKILYFPNKMLEFAYGLCAPTGENQDSLNTYTKHSDANNWSKYRSNELEKAVKALVKRSTVGFIMTIMEGDDYRSKDITNRLGNFLVYLQACLSLCVIFTEYKTGNINGEHEVASFKLRICDPEGHLINRDLTQSILQEAFMGGVGKVPFSYPPRVEHDVCLVEYAHEFNHDMAQATPLFAYKALESLKEQGMELSFQNLILGMAEDGSILKGSSSGVNLTKNLTHNICAGSQAGKGVMTLNILASGIASNKNIFYLDDKPDMASLLKYLAPNMVVINGSDIQPGYDAFNQWQGITLGNVPDEVTEAFNVNPSWVDLGDLIYMRTLKLVIALLMVRGSGHIDECFGGQEGILLVADEFSNFQRRYMSMVSSLTSILPPVTIEKARKSVEEGKMSETEFNRVYNNAGYYALSYLNSMMADVEYLKAKKDAGYDPLETARSDVFVIGQTLERGMFDYEEFKETFSKSSASGRYKSIDAKGVTKGSFAVGEQSIPFNLVNFKTADAFFGRNMDDGRDKYLAQTNRQSKARGRLDDKASNFAYMSTFSETTRKKIVHGSETENVNLANNCTYFKPFLILNSSGENDECVKKMFNRVQKNAGISPEELISINPSYNDPSKINEAIGFIDYIGMAGINDAKGVLEKSANILNHLVQDVLHYPGNWFQFVTDFSPEWLFTIRDVVDAVETGNCALFNPNTNPILQEYVDFNPERFGGNFEDATTQSEKAMDEFFFTDSTNEDFSDIEAMKRDEDERLGDIMGDNDYLHEDEEFDFSDDNDSFYEPLREAEITETGTEIPKEEDVEVNKVLELINQLKALGVNVAVDNPEPVYQQSEPTSFGEEFERIDYSQDINSLGALMQVITNDVISKFGGLERFNSFKVIGGSIVVNGYYYRCNIKDIYATNIPYDIRRDINSGNISKLFNYSALFGMVHIRDLEFDSVAFTYDYVSSQLGYGNSISVDKFFNDFRSLQVLTIGRKRFTRDGYIEQANGEDIFYKPKRSTMLADAAESYMSRFGSNSWTFTRNLARNSNCNRVLRVAGVVGGATASAVAGTAVVGSKVTRKAIKGIKVFGQGLKDLFNT